MGHLNVSDYTFIYEKDSKSSKKRTKWTPICTKEWPRYPFLRVLEGNWTLRRGLEDFFLWKPSGTGFATFWTHCGRHTKQNMQNRRCVSIPATWERIVRIFGRSNSSCFRVLLALAGQSARVLTVNRKTDVKIVFENVRTWGSSFFGLLLRLCGRK